MKYLVIGSKGFIGTWLLKYLKDAKGVDRDECDITNYEQVKNVIESDKPEIIINLAGIANPEKCKDEPELTRIIK